MRGAFCVGIGIPLAFWGVLACVQDTESASIHDAGDATDAGCAYAIPDGCPSPEPSWQSTVQPIIDRRCNGCHGDGGVQRSTRDFTTYGGVSRNSGSILTQVFSCKMPPPDAAAPSASERDALLGWLLCGAPNN
jgi:hypothetical protein